MDPITLGLQILLVIAQTNQVMINSMTDDQRRTLAQPYLDVANRITNLIEKFHGEKS